MDYYERKKQAMNLIKELCLTNKLKRDDIEFYILEKFGYSTKFVNTIIDKLIERGFLVEKKDGVIGDVKKT